MNLTLYLYLTAIILVAVLVTIGLSRAIKEYNGEYGASHVTDIKYDEKSQILHFRGGKSGTSHTFRGNCTVWHRLDGTRCPSTLEMSLSEIWHKWKYEQND